MKLFPLIACVLALLPFAAVTEAATVDVKTFGAIPNDAGSDTTAFRQAMISAGDGGTVLLDGGTFILDLPASGLELLPNRTYRGINGAVLKGKSSLGQILYIKGDNVTITGLGFNGGGVYLDKPTGGFNTGIVIDSCNFKLDVTGENPNGITFKSGLQNSRITNCYFTGYTSSFAIYGYNYQGLTIANLEIVNVRAGMHIDAFYNSGNLLVEQVYMSGLKGMGMEFQSTATGLVFQDNWYEKPNLSATFNDNNGTMAYSLILDKSKNIAIRRNVCIAPERPDRVGVRNGFELGGDNTICEDNYVDGTNHVVAMNDGVGSASVTVRNNRFKNYLQGPSNSFPRAEVTWVATNNGANVMLSPVMEQRIADQQKPGIGSKRYGNSTQGIPSKPPTTTQPATQPSGDYVAFSADLQASTNGWGPVEVNESVGEAGRDDGVPITLAGFVYPAGYGIHAPANLIGTAPARASRFVADIGIDDETIGKGSATVTIQIAGKTVAAQLMKPGAIWSANVEVGPGEKVQVLAAVNGSPDFAHVSVGYPRFMLSDVSDKDAQIAALQAELTRETSRANALQGALDLAATKIVKLEDALSEVKAALGN